MRDIPTGKDGGRAGQSNPGNSPLSQAIAKARCFGGAARSIARLYGSAATGGSEIGLNSSVLDALKKAAIPPTNGVRDKIMFVDSSFSLGFLKPASLTLFGSSDNAFGTVGVGGSFGFADPDSGVGYGYVMNKFGFHPISDPRELALRQVLFNEILRTRPQT